LSNLCDQDAKTQHALPNFVIDPPENLIFKGDDSTGLAYLGVIKALEAKGKINGIKRVAGPSTGALIATLFALGYSSEEIACQARFFSSFFDSPIVDQAMSAIPKDSPHLATLQRMLDIIQKHSPLGKDQFKSLHQLPSLCSGKALLDWIEERIYEKTGIQHCTFGELRELMRRNPKLRHLSVFTVRLDNTFTPTRFSSEDMTSDEIVISHTVCAALAVPGIFPLKSLYFKNKVGGVDRSPSLGLHCDAALINNFSIEAYDREKYQSVVPLGEDAGEYFRLNKRTLGFALEPRTRNYSEAEISTVHQLLQAALNTYCQMESSVQQSTLYNRFRVVQIQNQSIEQLSDFSLEEHLKRVIEAGEGSTVEFFDNQEFSASSQNPFIHGFERTNQGIKWTNLKSPLPYFVGRIEQIQTLKERLIPEEANLPTSSSSASSSSASSSSASSSTSPPLVQRRSCVILAGAGGMGKSETAIAFAHQYRDNFSVVWWIETATPQSMDRSFRQLAEALEIYIESTSSAGATRRRVYNFLKTENLGKPYLLIFDNAEELVELPQSGNGCILVTTTQPGQFFPEEILPITPFTEDESINLIAGILKQEANEEMKRLAVELEYLPAILSQAAQYIRTTPGMTLRKYLELLSKEKVKVLSMMPVDSRYSKAQLSTWRMTHETLKQQHRIAYEWLEICAYLQPDSIPSSYLETWLESLGEQNYVDRTFKRDEILRTLVNGGILRHDQKSDLYSLHRIRQEMIREFLTKSSDSSNQNNSLTSEYTIIQEHISEIPAICLLAKILELSIFKNTDEINFKEKDLEKFFLLIDGCEDCQQTTLLTFYHRLLVLYKNNEYQNALEVAIQSLLYNDVSDDYNIGPTNLSSVGCLYQRLGDQIQAEKCFSLATKIESRFKGDSIAKRSSGSWTSVGSNKPSLSSSSTAIPGSSIQYLDSTQANERLNFQELTTFASSSQFDGDEEMSDSSAAPLQSSKGQYRFSGFIDRKGNDVRRSGPVGRSVGSNKPSSNSSSKVPSGKYFQYPGSSQAGKRSKAQRLNAHPLSIQEGSDEEILDDSEDRPQYERQDQASQGCCCEKKCCTIV
jgi:predicted acylesterase/phospholipase RssA/tetratricopeptide (TPR) repeat protein